jgi:hypothetical protein
VVTIECVNELIAFGRFRVQKADTTVDASQDLIGVALCGMPDSSSMLIRRTLPCGRFDDAEIEGVQRVRRKGVWRLHGEWVWWPNLPQATKMASTRSSTLIAIFGISFRRP